MNYIQSIEAFYRSFIKSPVVLIALGLFMSLLLMNSAKALDVQCEVPLAVVCEVSDPDGFMSVRVNVDFGDLGQIDVVENSFPTCRTSATVSWDPIVPNAEILTTSCKSGVGGFQFGGIDPSSHVPVVQGFQAIVSETKRSISLTPIKTAPKALASGAFGRIGRYAKEKGFILDKTGLSTIDTGEYSMTSVPIAELDADDDITFPIDIMIVEIQSERSDLKSGVYTLRLTKDPYKKNVGKVVLLNEAGTIAVEFEGEFEPLGPESSSSGFDLVAEAQSGIMEKRRKICGKKKCFVWERVGFLKWKFGCTNKHTGAVVACAG